MIDKRHAMPFRSKQLLQLFLSQSFILCGNRLLKPSLLDSQIIFHFFNLIEAILINQILLSLLMCLLVHDSLHFFLVWLQKYFVLHSGIHPVLGYHWRIWVSKSVGWIPYAWRIASKRASCLARAQELSILPRLVDCRNWGALLEFNFLQGWPTLGVAPISSGRALLDTFLGWEQILKGLSLRLVNVTDQRVFIGFHPSQHLVRI